jgi:hypothetical protein
MDDMELHDLMGDLDSVVPPTVRDEIALLQVKAIAAHGYQLYRLGNLIEEILAPVPPRKPWWSTVRGWLGRGW